MPKIITVKQVANGYLVYADEGDNYGAGQGSTLDRSYVARSMAELLRTIQRIMVREKIHEPGNTAP